MSSARANRIITGVLCSPTLAVAAALALRVVLLWLSHCEDGLGPPRFQTVGLEDGLVASSLASGKGFFGPYPGYQTITALLAPAYPFLWAMGIKLFHLKSSGITIFSQMMNCVFSAVTCWPIFGIGKRIFGRGVGLATAWLWVFLPYAVLLPLEWTWDQSLSALTLTLLVFVTLVLVESVSSLALTGYGLFWAFAALVNPTLCIMFPFLLCWLIVRRGQGLRPSFASAAKIMLVFVLALLPWTIRNYYAVDGLVFIKSNFGMEFWLGNNPAVKEIYTPERHPASNVVERIQMILAGEPNYNREKQSEAVAYIKANPRAFMKNSFERIEDIWSASYDSRVEPWILDLHLSRTDIWFCSVFSTVSFAGMILALRANWKNVLPLAMCMMLFPIPYYITHTSLRYRHPIDPFMSVFTVYAIFWLRSAFFMRSKLSTQEACRKKVKNTPVINTNPNADKVL